jgi:hypothetical protein
VPRGRNRVRPRETPDETPQDPQAPQRSRHLVFSGIPEGLRHWGAVHRPAQDSFYAEIPDKSAVGRRWRGGGGLARAVLLDAIEKGHLPMDKRLFVFAAGLLVMAVPAAAQTQDKRAVFSVGGGYTAPNSDVRDHLGDGYNFTIGGQVNVNPMFGIEGLYSFNGLGDKRISLPVFAQPLDTAGTPTDFFGSMNMQYGTVAAVVQDPEGTVRPYGLTGVGVYYRPVKVTSPGIGFVPGYCDPWWYVCYPGGFVEVENVIGERSSTDFGMVFGGGVNFGAFYSELRYHYIWGPTVPERPTVQPLLVDVPTTSERKANGQFLALTFGVRF